MQEKNLDGHSNPIMSLIRKGSLVSMVSPAPITHRSSALVSQEVRDSWVKAPTTGAGEGELLAE